MVNTNERQVVTEMYMMSPLPRLGLLTGEVDLPLPKKLYKKDFSVLLKYNLVLEFKILVLVKCTLGCSTSWPDTADFPEDFLPAICIYKTYKTPSGFTFTKSTVCEILV